LVQFSLTQEVPLFDAIVGGGLLYSLLQYFVSRNKKRPSIVRFEVYFDILNCLGVTHKCDGRTDGQTDGQTV